MWPSEHGFGETIPPRWGIALVLLVTLGAGLVVGLMLFEASPLSSPPSPGIVSNEVCTGCLEQSDNPVIVPNGDLGSDTPEEDLKESSSVIRMKEEPDLVGGGGTHQRR